MASLSQLRQPFHKAHKNCVVHGALGSSSTVRNQIRKLFSPTFRWNTRVGLTTNAESTARVGLFPAGKQQARIQLPAVIISVESCDVATDALLIELESAIQEGATGFLLRDSQSGGADLFEAALRLKTQARGRCIVLIEDRADIAAAAQADGVLLTSKGAFDL